ncbi:MAG: hypothetical protein ACI8RZ_003437 [Myxococcota bacterium]|jgi:hypothetical protein
MQRMGLFSVVSCVLLSACTAPSDSVSYTPDGDHDGFESSPLSGPSDCNDEDPLIHPDALELCDGVDNNCNGEVDEGDAIGAVTWFADLDGDGFGESDFPTTACTRPEGYADNPIDCDDANPDAFPGSDEVCDFADNDCDGTVDEGTALDATTWYADSDADGYGSPYDAQVGCTQPSGFVANDEDRDDTDSDLHPGIAEICDGLDNDCDGAFDDATPYYPDGDTDGYGDSALGEQQACSPPAGFSEHDGDCDDTEPTTSPDAVEVCGDGVDNDCDDLVDPCTQDVTLTASAAGDRLGESVAGIGDFDGDGFDDFAVGASRASTTGTSEGAVYILTGSSVSIGEDFNGDGYNDALISAPEEDTAGSLSGAVYLVHGPISGDIGLADADALISAESSHDYLGSSLASAGDLNDDDIPDLLIGASKEGRPRRQRCRGGLHLPRPHLGRDRGWGVRQPAAGSGHFRQSRLRGRRDRGCERRRDRRCDRRRALQRLRGPDRRRCGLGGVRRRLVMSSG